MSDYIPPELVTEILKRLPAKSLLRFRCVCKEWKTLISSPNFVSKHLSHSSSSSSTVTRTLVRHYSKAHRKEMYNIYSELSSAGEATRISPPFRVESNKYYRVVAYCNGVLFLSDDLFNHMHNYTLWNPSINRIVTLPTPHVDVDVYGPYRHTLGFGFDAKNDDYKVVRLSYLKPDYESRCHVAPPLVEVYSLSSGKWGLAESKTESFIPHGVWSQAFINGVVHWVSFNLSGVVEGRSYTNSILTFDLSEDTFGNLGLPKVLADVAPPMNINAAILRGSLSVIYSDFTGDADLEMSAFAIFAMKEYGNVRSWTLLHKIELYGWWGMVVGMQRSGEVLLSKSNGDLLSYNCSNDIVTKTGICGSKFSFFVDDYVESLALLGKGEEVRGSGPEPDFEDEEEWVESRDLNRLTLTLSSIAYEIKPHDE